MTRLNYELQERLKEEFKPKGIIAFTNCCRYGCTGNYGDMDDDFEVREDGGIYFFYLPLEGMNHKELVYYVYASYDSYDYLMNHWEKECDMIRRWADILNVTLTEIVKPKNENQAICIWFDTPLLLENYSDEEDEDEKKIERVKKRKVE